MPIHYRIDEQEGLIHTTWEGDVDADDLREHWLAYLNDPAVMTLRRSLVDVRGAHIHFHGTDLSNLIKSLVLPALAGRDWILAIVIANEVQYGLSRQFHVFADTFSKDQIFYNMDAAREWVLRQPHTDSP